MKFFNQVDACPYCEQLGIPGWRKLQMGHNFASDTTTECLMCGKDVRLGNPVLQYILRLGPLAGLFLVPVLLAAVGIDRPTRILISVGLFVGIVLGCGWLYSRLPLEQIHSDIVSIK